MPPEDTALRRDSVDGPAVRYPLVGARDAATQRTAHSQPQTGRNDPALRGQQHEAWGRMERMRAQAPFFPREASPRKEEGKQPKEKTQ